MKFLLGLFFTISFLYKLPAQNLLANAGFEDRNICTEAGADCNPAAWFKVPSDEIQEPQKDVVNGVYAEKIVMENLGSPGDSRSFIYTKLLCSLQKDSTYIFSAYIKIPGNHFNHLDVWMTEQPPMQTGKKLVDIVPQLSLTSNNKTATYNNNWKKYAISFRAAGTESFLMIGNFSKQALKENLANTVNNKEVIYEIDSVNLMPANKQTACKEYDKNLQTLYGIHNRHSMINFTDTLNQEVRKPIDIIAETLLQKEDTITLPDILFSTNSYEINPAFKNKLDSIISVFDTAKIVNISICGHTDNTGGNSYNMLLSKSRADAVKEDILIKQPMLKERISSSGAGDSQPKAMNNTTEGRILNRRVEIIIKHRITHQLN